MVGTVDESSSVSPSLRVAAGPEPTIGDVVALVEHAGAALIEFPTFDNAIEACSAARVAWAFYYSAWLRNGAGPAPETMRLQKSFRDISATLESVKPGDPQEQGRLAHFKTNVDGRTNMLDLLATEGAETVHKALTKILAKLTGTAV